MCGKLSWWEDDDEKKDAENSTQPADLWSNLSEDERKSIEQGILDADSGKLNPHSEARKLYEKWL